MGVAGYSYKRLGRYRLLARLAAGGMGEIFLAQRDPPGPGEERVVVKRLLPGLAADAHFVAMLLDEARFLARMSHPNVCRVHELGEEAGELYIAMEYLDGLTVTDVLRSAFRARRPLDGRLVVGLAQQACDGLHHAHELRDQDGTPLHLVHRDVSPSNLFVTADGVLKVLDFGIAKARGARSNTRTGILKGKYAYMSPEQAEGAELDRRSDVFSLGVVLFEMLTLRRLFYRDSELRTLQAVCSDPIPRVDEFRDDVPPALGEVVSRALARDPAVRYQSAAALSRALGDAVHGLGRPARPREIVRALAGPMEDERLRRDEMLTVTGPLEADDEIEPTTSMGLDELPTVERSRTDEPIAREAGPGPLSTASVRPVHRRRMQGAMLVALACVLVAGGLLVWRLLRDRPAAGAGSVAQGRPDVTAGAASAGDAFSRTFAGRREEVLACLSGHDGDPPGSLRLILNIDQAGRVTAAAVQPPGLGETELGRCVTEVAASLRFDPLERPVEVVIPVRVRRDQ